MTKYKAKDGLNVLTYLGILNLTEQERKVFKEKWNDVYSYDRDFIGAIWKLYAEVLPFTCGDADRRSFVVAQIRDDDFGVRLEKTKLEEKLKQGISLKKIFADSPERFAKLN